MSDQPAWNVTDPNREDELERLPKIAQDRYKVLSKLGHGGMGIVLKASHARLDKLVAIKVLNANLLTDEASIKRFEIEAKAGSKLSHPNLISVFDYGLTEDGQPYLVMEYVEGKSLHDSLLEKGTLATELFLEIFIQTTKALQYVHKHNIIHRDLKPSNIMLEEIDGDLYAKLLDFGVAKVLADSGMTMHNLTETGTAFGSPLYMSPEQCMGKDIDVRSDIYSMGCMMYQCVVGEPPVIGTNALETIHMQANGEAPPLIQTDPEDTAMQKIAYLIYKSLKKNADERIQSSAELLTALEDVKQFIDSQKFTGENRIAASAAGSVSNRWKTPNKAASELENSDSGSVSGSTDDLSLQAPGAKNPGQVGQSFINDDKTLALEGRNLDSSAETSNNTEIGAPGTRQRDIELRQLTTQSLRKKDVMQEAPSQSKPNEIKSVLVGVLVVGALLATGFIGYPYLQSYMDSSKGASSLAKADQLMESGGIGYEKAKPLYLEALKVARNKKEIETVARILNVLGSGELGLNHGKNARTYFEEAITVLADKKEFSGDTYISSLIGLAKCYQNSGEFKKAEEELEKVRKLESELQVSPELVGDRLVVMARNLVRQDKESSSGKETENNQKDTSKSKSKEDALALYDEAIKEYSKLDKSHSVKVANTWLESAELSLKLKFEKDAARRAKQALALAKDVKMAHFKDEIERKAKQFADLDKSVATSTTPVPAPASDPSSSSAVTTGGDVDLSKNIELAKKKNEGEEALAKLELERIERAKKAAEELAKYQRESSAKTSRMLRSMSKSAKSVDGYSRPQATSPSSLNDLKQFSKSFVEK